MQIEEMLEPVSELQPCGDDLSFSAEFDRIQESRREDDPNVDYGDWQTTLKQADWHAVVADCRQLLIARSKDLRLASWLAEGMVKTSGLAGLLGGLEIVARLLARFGAGIHPQAESDDQERRIATLNWFAARMAQLVPQIPLTRSNGACYNLNDYEAAQQLQLQLQRNAESVEKIDGKLTLEKFSSAVGKTPKALYVEWMSETGRAITALAHLTEVCDRQFRFDGPSFAKLSDKIGAVHERLRMIARGLGISVPGEDVRSDVPRDPADGPVAAQDNSVHDLFRTRAEALNVLRQVADFFRKTEPHSPVAYLADKAATWGSMPLHVWLRSVVKDHGTLSHLEEALGLDKEQDRAGAG